MTSAKGEKTSSLCQLELTSHAFVAVGTPKHLEDNHGWLRDLGQNQSHTKTGAAEPTRASAVSIRLNPDPLVPIEN